VPYPQAEQRVCVQLRDVRGEAVPHPQAEQRIRLGAAALLQPLRGTYKSHTNLFLLQYT